MKEIDVDFNCGQDSYGKMSLDTRGALDSLRETGAVAGETVLLVQDELSAKAVLVEINGRMYGQFKWDDIVVDEDYKWEEK